MRGAQGESGALCFTGEQLSARIAHYSSRATPSRGASVVLDVLSRDAVELHIFRKDALVSRRRFEQLPAACADRRDAIALSIALALEQSAKAAEGSGSASGAATDAAPSTGARADSETRNDAAPAEATRDAASRDEPGAQPAQDNPARAEPAAPEPQPAAATAAPAPDAEADRTPVVLGTLPSSTSHSRRGDGGPSLQLHLGGRFIAEALPMSVWAGALGVQLPLSKRVALDISALASLQGEASFGVGRARAGLLGLELLGCGSLPLGPFALDLCAGGAAAICEVSGRDYPIARPEATLLWAAGLARAVLRWPRDTLLSVRLLTQAHVNVSRPELRVDGLPDSLHPGWFGFTLGFELFLTLP